MSYAPRHDHPPEQDLENFAREQLGERKKARILQHCRQCPECADRLIELTRELAPPPGPLKLTRWNKIWLWLLLLSLVAATAGLAWTLRQMSRQPGLVPGPEMQLPPDRPDAADPERGETPPAAPAPERQDGQTDDDQDSRPRGDG